MAKRHKMGGAHSRRSFTRGALKTHRKNITVAAPMRGGIRL